MKFKQYTVPAAFDAEGRLETVGYWVTPARALRLSNGSPLYLDVEWDEDAMLAFVTVAVD